jgi:hypothetical protein
MADTVTGKVAMAEATTTIMDHDGTRVVFIEIGERYPLDSATVKRHHLIFRPVDDESEMLHDSREPMAAIYTPVYDTSTDQLLVATSSGSPRRTPGTQAGHPRAPPDAGKPVGPLPSLLTLGDDTIAVSEAGQAAP